MKKIIIVFPAAMHLGGIERALLGLLDVLAARNDVETDLFLYGHHGELYEYINPRINQLPEVKELSLLNDSLWEKIRAGCFYSAWVRLICEIRKGKQDHFYLSESVRKKCAPQVYKDYDLAIGFFRPFDFLKYNVRAKIKIGWIHTDYTKCKEDYRALERQYEGLDYIAAVSDSCGESFKSVFPRLSDKVITVENILPKSLIMRQANEFCDLPVDDKRIKLLSIGRYTIAKNFDNVPDICKRIVHSGCDVVWYIIGYGSEEDLIREKIKVAGMEDRVILLGKKANPYPYINACDLYVQPSRFEGRSVAVTEAQMLGKPVVITDYPTAQSQLEDGVDGVIVPMDNEKCADGIVSVLIDQVMMRKLSLATRERDYSNAAEINKIMKIMH